MRTNVGDTDKLTRTAVGAIAGAVSLAILAEAVSLPAVLGLAAAVLLVTSYTGVCPLYSMLGVDTCSVGN